MGADCVCGGESGSVGGPPAWVLYTPTIKHVTSPETFMGPCFRDGKLAKTHLLLARPALVRASPQPAGSARAVHASPETSPHLVPLPLISADQSAPGQRMSHADKKR